VRQSELFEPYSKDGPMSHKRGRRITRIATTVWDTEFT